ncbi:hypothetical protein M885DRAFT_16700 [Pelagophyceae sp. CCMP2097]|nr:hypothetical protein M885DRAFT_16700 [Pelagophyceae sp. CCMP2097]
MSLRPRPLPHVHSPTWPPPTPLPSAFATADASAVLYHGPETALCGPRHRCGPPRSGGSGDAISVVSGTVSGTVSRAAPRPETAQQGGPEEMRRRFSPEETLSPCQKGTSSKCSLWEICQRDLVRKASSRRRRLIRPFSNDVERTLPQGPRRREHVTGPRRRDLHGTVLQETCYGDLGAAILSRALRRSDLVTPRDSITGTSSTGPCDGALVPGNVSRGSCQRDNVTGTSSRRRCHRDLVKGPFATGTPLRAIYS